ncbi:MAG TPA: bifunctional glutamate N-acetyltransferase/amino-acid acetyltransferase ArgJ [Armatimonadota bacterium]|nr:bifunctional glutamate N-acetyltransferase/amino-acid acetyltransferase ArgJ [Armatimonadota bacterium]
MELLVDIREILGGVTAPLGFRASGVACGLKPDGRDLMLLVADRVCSAAGVFTTSVVKAAPVIYSSKRVKAGRAQAVVINSGIANACTGDEGMVRCEQMAKEVAYATGLVDELVLVCSTGVIGRQLPMEKILAGIGKAARVLTPKGGHDAALAIMTTDTKPKEIAVVLETEQGEVRIAGMAKGSGMIAPNMATMLSVITTDAQIDPDLLQSALRSVVDRTFNRVTVDGDTSTNDTLLALASGMSGVRLQIGTQDFARFERALYTVAETLAKSIARDGEGATKLVEVWVHGAPDDAAATAIVKTIANSPLVKTAIFGNDPNWGRILAAAGRAGVNFDPTRVDLDLAGIPVVRSGQPVEFDKAAASDAMKTDAVIISLSLAEGEGEAVAWTCDFSYDYVRINADYTT